MMATYMDGNSSLAEVELQEASGRKDYDRIKLVLPRVLRSCYGPN